MRQRVRSFKLQYLLKGALTPGAPIAMRPLDIETDSPKLPSASEGSAINLSIKSASVLLAYGIDK